MKIRTGFVSNSSSSSFLVVFPKIPKSKEECKKIVFGDRTSVTFVDDPIPTERVAETIFADIKEQKPLTVKKVKDRMREMASGLPGAPDYFLGRRGLEVGSPEWEEMREVYDKCLDEFAIGTAEEFLEKAGGRPIFLFSYGDDDGDYFATLEHGDIFFDMGHIRINHH